jgi:glycosyltransferase involved in cell wall biosynthesis
VIRRPSTAAREIDADGRPPDIAILLGTCQGERFLAAQLDSIAAQTHTHWRVWASDDHSTDGTLSVLDDYRRR